MSMPGESGGMSSGTSCEVPQSGVFSPKLSGRIWCGLVPSLEMTQSDQKEATAPARWNTISVPSGDHDGQVLDSPSVVSRRTSERSADRFAGPHLLDVDLGECRALLVAGNLAL